MESGSSSHSNWNNLPNEIKIKIIQELDNNARLSLRACSLDDYQLVDSVPFRTIHKMCIWNDDDEKYHIDITRNMYGSEATFVFESFQEFQNKLMEEIENCDCIHSLTTNLIEYTEQQLKLTKSGKLLKVRKLTLGTEVEETLDILPQIDPTHLRKLKHYHNDEREGFFDTPQAKQVHNLHACGKKLTDDQLLRMENSKLYLRSPKRLTIAGINKYIKKCILTLDSKPVSFEMEFKESKKHLNELFDGIEAQEIVRDIPNYDFGWKCILNSSSEKNQLEVNGSGFNIEAITIRKNGQVEKLQNSETRNSFKYVNCVDISLNRLIITERGTDPVHYVLDSIEEVQKKLTEEISKLKYIKHLRIHGTFHDWILCPQNKQVTIGKLSVHCGSISADFLKQIEPVHLKRIKSYSYKTDETIYDTPQLINAQNIDIANRSVPQIINTTSVKVFYNSSQLKTLTESEINKFTKTMLTYLNKHDSDNFDICHLEIHRNADDLSQGLRISSKQQVHDTVKNMVNSSFPGFELEFSETDGPYSDKIIIVVDK